MADCTCNGDRWPDGERVVTVGCRVHHLMDDGAPAADHEIRCACGNFADDRKCVLFVSDEETMAHDAGEPFYVCTGCASSYEEESHLHRLSRGTSRKGHHPE